MPSERETISVTQHVYSNVAIAAVFNTRQARVLEGYDSLRIATEAAGACIDGGGDRRRRDRWRVRTVSQ